MVKMKWNKMPICGNTRNTRNTHLLTHIRKLFSNEPTAKN